MEIKAKILYLLTHPILVRYLLFFRPRRFLINLYFSSLVSSSALPKASILKIASGYGRGLRMSLRMGDKFNPQETYYWLGLNELNVQRLFNKIIKTGFIVYDIGAYIGFYSLLAGRLTGLSGRVYAFEPFPGNVERIKLHISLNRMQDRIFCIPQAVTDRTGNAVHQNFGRDDWGRFTNIDSCAGNYSTGVSPLLETISLDEFVFKEGYQAPNVVKIDVEGGEGRVIAGAQRLLKEFSPIIICELHSHESAREIYERLLSLGYRLEDLKGNQAVSMPNYSHIVAWPSKAAYR